MDAVNWVCDDAVDEHVWVSKQTISLQEAEVLEALQYDLEIPSTVQWGLGERPGSLFDSGDSDNDLGAEDQ